MNDTSHSCKLCGSSVEYRFSLTLVDGLLGQYHECNRCHLLQSWHLDSLSPSALDEFYRKSRTLEEDSGAAWRQHCIATRLTHLRRLHAFPSQQPLRFLDYGGGSGFTASFVSHRFGWSAHTFDAYSTPSFSPQKLLRSWGEVVENGPYDVVVATEVVEHLLRPREDILALGAILSRQACVYLTTGLYLPGVRDANWNYLAPQTGQHVCFYSADAIQGVAQLLGASPAVQVGADYEWFIARSKTRSLELIAKTLRLGVRLGLSPKIE